MQPAFKIAEKHGHSLNAFLIRQIFEPLLLNLVDSNAVLALLFGFQVQLL